KAGVASPEAPPAKLSRAKLALIGLGSAAVCLLGALFLIPRSSTPGPPPSTAASTPAAAPKPTVGAPFATPQSPAGTSQLATGSGQGQAESPKTKTEKPAGAQPEVFALAEDYLRYKNFAKAQERLEALDKQLPKDDAGRAKLVSLRAECQSGSQAALNELLKNAEPKAQAGDANAVRQLFNPHRIQDLLPEQAERAAKERDKFLATTDAAAKANQEKRETEAAARRANFEANLPAAGALAAAKGTVIYGPDGLQEKMTWKDGKDCLRQPAGKVPYLDCTQNITFKGNAALTMVSDTPFVIEYSASEDCEIKIVFEIDQFGRRAGSFRFPKGSLRTLEINPNKDSALPNGKRGNATGRQINAFGVEPKNVKPGMFALFRVTR
ncbi:MAG: hypothetical protein ABSE73_29830, partial [Planctomycetota bacterium]